MRRQGRPDNDVLNTVGIQKPENQKHWKARHFSAQYSNGFTIQIMGGQTSGPCRGGWVTYIAVVLGQSYNLSLNCSLEYVQRNVIAK